MDPNKESSYSERRSLRSETAHHYYIPASHQAFRVLYFGFIVLPIIAGMDKFFHVLVDWTIYLSPKITATTGVGATQFMYGVGVIEILAGLWVAVNPKLGGLAVCAWLGAIILNLLTIPAFFDIALRDFGLALGAFALSRLSQEFRYYRRY